MRWLTAGVTVHDQPVDLRSIKIADFTSKLNMAALSFLGVR
jgi:hypothetical protein